MYFFLVENSFILNCQDVQEAIFRITLDTSIIYMFVLRARKITYELTVTPTTKNKANVPVDFMSRHGVPYSGDLATVSKRFFFCFHLEDSLGRLFRIVEP